MEQSNNKTIEPEEIKPGRDYTFVEVTISHIRNFKPGDMFIFKSDMSEKAWETFKSFMAESQSFVTKHKMDEPGGPSWNEFAKFFLREFAWAAKDICNDKQLKIINLKNRLKKKIITVPFECVHARAIKN